MARSKYSRKMQRPPRILGLKPFGQRVKGHEMVELLYEEYEAIRLCDYLALSQEQAAEKMQISRPTLTRILERGRKKLAQALVEGHSLLLKGGHVFFDEEWYRCQDCDTLYAMQTVPAKHCPHCRSSRYIHINQEVGGGIMRQHGQGMRHRNQSGQGRVNDFGMGPAGKCVCLHCGVQAAHEPGIPCKDSLCPQCGKKMVREGSYHHEQYLARKEKTRTEENEAQE